MYCMLLYGLFVLFCVIAVCARLCVMRILFVIDGVVLYVLLWCVFCG